MSRLLEIQNAVRLRVQAITSRHDWPCRKGCDECCRRLATVPRVTREEWLLIAAAMDELSAGAAERVRRRIRDSVSASRPVTCPLLDPDSATCLVYQARPVACRAYGFYAERELVLGCSRIESVSRQASDVVWGNHPALEQRMDELGEAAELSDWLARGS